MMQDTITVNGVIYAKIQPTGPWKVYMLNCGWTLIGNAETRDGDEKTVHNARCIRKYGDGIGVQGIVDKKGLAIDNFKADVIVPASKVIFSYKLPQDWNP